MNRKFFLTMLHTHSVYSKKRERYYQKIDLTTGQPKVLYILRDKEGYMQKELAQTCQVEPPSMTVLLKNMEKKGLIRREKVLVSGGKRAFRVYLTEKGRDMANKVYDYMEELEAICFRGFSSEERVTLLDLLERVSTNLSEN